MKRSGKKSSNFRSKRLRSVIQNFEEENYVEDDPIDVNKFLANDGDGVRIKEERNFDDSASLDDYDQVLFLHFSLHDSI